jgi:hypothetical protein
MPVDRYTGEFVYHNEYEVKDFYIRFPHYEKNALFMPVIRYVYNGEEVYQRIYMPLYDWQRLFEAEGVDLKAVTESENQEHHFVKTILIHHEGCFFESCENDYEEEDDEAQRMRLDGGGEFDGVDAEWFAFESLAVAENNLTSEIAELVEKACEAVFDVIYLTGEKNGIKADVAMVYTDSYSWKCRSYVNNFETRCGGSHCDGFRAGLADVYNKFLKDDIKVNNWDAVEGLCAVIKVNIPEFNYDPLEPEYKDQTVLKNVKAIVKKEFGKYLEENPSFAVRFSANALLCAKARLAAERGRKAIRRH